jgi:hypothetical protein
LLSSLDSVFVALQVMMDWLGKLCGVPSIAAAAAAAAASASMV